MVWAARLGQHDHLATMLAAGGNPNAKVCPGRLLALHRDSGLRVLLKALCNTVSRIQDSNTLSIILETGPLLNYVLTQAHESTDYPRKLAAHLRMALVLVHAGANVTATDQVRGSSSVDTARISTHLAKHPLLGRRHPA